MMMKTLDVRKQRRAQEKQALAGGWCLTKQ